MLKDLHVHTTYCDGENTPQEIVLCAIDKGLDVLGFSGHSYTFFDESWCMSKEGTAAYKKEISALKAKYSDKIEILCGTEQDFYSDASVGGYDYFIGSVHYLCIPGDDLCVSEGCIKDNGFIYIPVDESADILKDAADEYFCGDMYMLAENYFATCGNWALKSIKPDLIGHFDLIAKFNDKEKLFDESDPRYVSAWKRAADKLIKAGFIFEINTGAVSRGYKAAPYPSLQIQEYIAQNGGKFIMSSDSHNKDTLLYGFEEFKRKELALWP